VCAACSIISVLTQWGATLVIKLRESHTDTDRRRVGRLKGLSENVPTFETVFASVYHCAIPELYKSMCHRYGVWHESPRPQIHRFRPQAPAPLPGVCFLSTALSLAVQ
jgi:hypothetical protein